MSPELDKILCTKYPKIFTGRSREFWGFECGDGWFNLIDGLCEKIQKEVDSGTEPQVVAQQVKEKFGGLRFYVGSASDKVFDLIEFAEKLSYTICDVCGKPGTTEGNSRGWVSTRCEEHRT